MSFLVERVKEIQEWNEQKLPKVLPGYSCQGEAKRNEAEEKEEEEKESRERQVRYEIVQKWLRTSRKR